MPNFDPVHQHYLAFDFGLKHIGVAYGQSITYQARPLITLAACDGIPNWDAIATLLTQWSIQALVVGIPKNMDGSEQTITHCTYAFIKRLKKRYTLPIFTIDEQLTTVEAKDRLFQQQGYKGLSKAKIDAMAATVILESYFATLR